MSNCITGKFGQYEKMINLKFPNFLLKENGGYYNTKDSCAVDSCMVDEIEHLWKHGIHTMGSCCGHGVTDGIINVLTENDREKMVNLGYKVVSNIPNGYCKLTFVSKSKHIE